MAAKNVGGRRDGGRSVAHRQRHQPQPASPVTNEAGAAGDQLGGHWDVQRSTGGAGATASKPTGWSASRTRNLTNPLQVCVVCGHQAKERSCWASLVFPCCSAQCVDVVADYITSAVQTFITWEIEKLSGLTHMERSAVKAARQSLYDALIEIGIADAFNDCTAEQIDSVIEAVWNGLRASMHLQSAKGDMPI